MADLTHLFHIGQKIKYKVDDFDSMNKFENGTVTEVYHDHIIVNLTSTNTDMYCEEGFNIGCVYPVL